MSVSLVVVIVLMLGVIFVNGWTDAPNAIATVVSTRVLSPGAAVRMAVVFNFLGALVMTIFNAKVAATLSNIVDFSRVPANTSGNTDHLALVVLAAAMFAIVLWAVAAWAFGIPTSESHALIAGVTGAALAFGGLGAVNRSAWTAVIVGLGISSVIGFGMGFLVTKVIELICGRMNRQVTNRTFAYAQVGGGAAMAFMHGAQDGQKFMGTFLLGVYLYNNAWVKTGANGDFIVPFWLIVLCSLTMGVGTSIGGYRIIKAVGMDMVKLEKYQGFAADVAASLCLLASSLTGVPVSTTPRTPPASI